MKIRYDATVSVSALSSAPFQVNSVVANEVSTIISGKVMTKPSRGSDTAKKRMAPTTKISGRHGIGPIGSPSVRSRLNEVMRTMTPRAVRMIPRPKGK